MLNYLAASTFFFFFFLVFLGPHLWHMEVPRLGVKLELQLLAYATATGNTGNICNLHCSLRQCQSLTHWARPGTEYVSSWIWYQVLNPLSHNGNSSFHFLFYFIFFYKECCHNIFIIVLSFTSREIGIRYVLRMETQSGGVWIFFWIDIANCAPLIRVPVYTPISSIYEIPQILAMILHYQMFSSLLIESLKMISPYSFNLTFFHWEWELNIFSCARLFVFLVTCLFKSFIHFFPLDCWPFS